jgi:acetyltransferase-like isoleucine patch superfamily enzyme
LASRIVTVRNFLFRNVVVVLRREYYRRVWGMDIGEGVHISLTTKLDLSNPGGVHIGAYSCLAFGSVVLTHDFINNVHSPVRIGKNCLIGARSVIMPGVTIGDHCIVGVGSIVMRNVPARSIVMGNPARVMETDIDTGPWGQRIRKPVVQDTQSSPADIATLGNAPLLQ